MNLGEAWGITIEHEDESLGPAAANVVDFVPLENEGENVLKSSSLDLGLAAANEADVVPLVQSLHL